MWALLAVVAQGLRHGALGYGLLNACIGIGAVAGAVVLPRLRARLSPDRIVVLASAGFVVALLVMAFVEQTAVIVVALLLAGFAWISTTSTFNIAVQEAVPAWVQARALGTYQMVFQGGLACGSAAWGYLAEHSSTRVALSLAAAGLVAGLPLARRFRIVRTERLDLTPIQAAGLARAAPLVVIELNPEEGPVLISIEYRIDPAQGAPFTEVMHELKHIRMRDGAMRWGLFKDPVDPARYVETFLVESWAEYLRQRERMTMNDLDVRSRAYAFQKGELPPPISRMVYAATSRPKD
jgi:MFS family permease